MMNESYARIFGLLQWQINDALTDDDAVKMIVDAVKGRYMVASEPILAALKLDKTAKEPEVLGAVLALQHPGNVVPLAEHQAVQSELLTLKSAKLINDAIGVEGKLAPSQKPWAEEILATHGYDVLAAALAKMPRTIPVGLKAPEGPSKEQQQSVPLASASAGEQLTALALQIQNSDKVPFSDALRVAQSRQPALAQQHLADMRGAN